MKRLVFLVFLAGTVLCAISAHSSTIGNYYTIYNQTDQTVILDVTYHYNSDEWYIDNIESASDVSVLPDDTVLLHIEASGNNSWKFSMNVMKNGELLTTIQIVGHQDGEAANNGGFDNDIYLITQITDNAIGASNQNQNIVSVTDYEYTSGQYSGQYYQGNIYIANPSEIKLDQWMKQYADTIKNVPFNRLLIPGTHDSGMYASAVTPNTTADLESCFFNAADGTVEKWAITQQQNIYEQLHHGIRYFDLRVTQQYWNSSVVQEPMICHSVQGPWLEDVLSQVLQFLEEPDHEKEIIILDFNHFYDVNSDDVADLIYDYLKPYLMPGLKLVNVRIEPGKKTLYNMTIGDFWNLKSNIHAFFNSLQYQTIKDALYNLKVVLDAYNPQVIVLWNDGAKGANLPSKPMYYYVVRNPYPDNPKTDNGVIEQNCAVYNSPYSEGTSWRSPSDLTDSLEKYLSLDRDPNIMFVFQTQPTESAGPVIGSDASASNKAPRNLYQYNCLFANVLNDWLNEYVDWVTTTYNANIMINNFSNYWQSLYCINQNITNIGPHYLGAD